MISEAGVIPFNVKVCVGVNSEKRNSSYNSFKSFQIQDLANEWICIHCSYLGRLFSNCKDSHNCKLLLRVLTHRNTYVAFRMSDITSEPLDSHKMEFRVEEAVWIRSQPYEQIQINPAPLLRRVERIREFSSHDVHSMRVKL
jgi:hypothetical protein